MKTTLEVEIGQVKQRDAVVIIVCTDGGIVPGLRYEVHRGCKGTAFPRNFCVLQNAFTGSKTREQGPTDHFILPNHPEIHEKLFSGVKVGLNKMDNLNFMSNLSKTHQIYHFRLILLFCYLQTWQKSYRPTHILHIHSLYILRFPNSLYMRESHNVF